MPEPFARYLPIDDTLFAAPLYLTGAGRAVIPPGATYPPPGHPELYQFSWHEGRVLPEFSLLWVEAGGGQWETRNGAFPIGAGQVGRVFSGHWHRYRPDTAGGWTECWVQFNGRLAHELETYGQSAAGNPVCTPSHAAEFARQMRGFLTDLADPAVTNSATLGLRLVGLLGLLPAPGPAIANPGPGLVETARRHIWSHSHRQLGVADVARALGVGRRTLERAFAGAGLGVLDEIAKCRANRAERLLRETMLPVQHIASLAGFGTAERMRQRFQASHGCPPNGFRKRGRA